MSQPARQLVAATLLILLGSSCGGSDDEPATRSYEIGLTVEDSMERYRYVATDAVDIRVGDEVTFEMDNTGTLLHDLVVVDPAGATIAKADPVAPGDAISIAVRFDEAGFFRLQCLVDDHLTVHRMQQVIEVTEPDSGT